MNTEEKDRVTYYYQVFMNAYAQHYESKRIVEWYKAYYNL